MVPGLMVPGRKVPGLTGPGRKVPGLKVPGLKGLDQKAPSPKVPKFLGQKFLGQRFLVLTSLDQKCLFQRYLGPTFPIQMVPDLTVQSLKFPDPSWRAGMSTKSATAAASRHRPSHPTGTFPTWSMCT